VWVEGSDDTFLAGIAEKVFLFENSCWPKKGGDVSSFQRIETRRGGQASLHFVSLTVGGKTTKLIHEF
jgi:hypothetical protein